VTSSFGLLLTVVIVSLALGSSLTFWYLSLRKKPGAGKLSPSPEMEPKDAAALQKRLEEIRRDFVVELTPSEPAPLQFRFIDKDGLSGVQIGIRMSNQGKFPLSIHKIVWEVWISELIHSGVFSLNLHLPPLTVSEKVVLYDNLNDPEVEELCRIEQQSDASRTAYVEGKIYGSTACGPFEKQFSICDLRYFVEGARPKSRKVTGEIPLDALTGFFTRQFLEERFQEVIDNTVYRHPLSFLMVDVDNFKEINDSYGHLAGDEVLKSVSDRIKEIAGSQGIAVRYGGDEFGLLFKNCDAEEASQIAEKIRAAVENSEFHDSQGKSFSVTLSLGVATLRERTEGKILIRYADDVLQLAKKQGKNRVVVNRRKIMPLP